MVICPLVPCSRPCFAVIRIEIRKGKLLVTVDLIFFNRKSSHYLTCISFYDPGQTTGLIRTSIFRSRYMFFSFIYIWYNIVNNIITFTMFSMVKELDHYIPLDIIRIYSPILQEACVMLVIRDFQEMFRLSSTTQEQQSSYLGDYSSEISLKSRRSNKEITLLKIYIEELTEKEKVSVAPVPNSITDDLERYQSWLHKCPRVRVWNRNAPISLS